MSFVLVKKKKKRDATGYIKTICVFVLYICTMYNNNNHHYYCTTYLLDGIDTTIFGVFGLFAVSLYARTIVHRTELTSFKCNVSLFFIFFYSIYSCIRFSTEKKIHGARACVCMSTKNQIRNVVMFMSDKCDFYFKRVYYFIYLRIQNTIYRPHVNPINRS